MAVKGHSMCTLPGSASIAYQILFIQYELNNQRTFYSGSFGNMTIHCLYMLGTRFLSKPTCTNRAPVGKIKHNAVIELDAEPISYVMLVFKLYKN